MRHDAPEWLKASCLSWRSDAGTAAAHTNPNKLLPLPRIDLVSMCHVRAPRTSYGAEAARLRIQKHDMSEENDISVSSLVSYLHAATDEILTLIQVRQISSILQDLGSKHAWTSLLPHARVRG